MIDVRNGVQQPRAVHNRARERPPAAAGIDRPQEVVEVFVGQDASSEEHGHRNDGNDAHVSKVPLETTAETPQHNRDGGDSNDEPLRAGEWLLHHAGLAQ